MKCAWDTYLNLLPNWIRGQVDNLCRETLLELRLRIARPPELVTRDGSQYLNRNVNVDDLQYCINAASQYSPWASSTISNGFITAPGGHRIGICGDAVIIDGKLKTMKRITSLCIRVARDFPGIASSIADISGSSLIIGSPGTGKTTLLRDMIRMLSNNGTGAITVVDERREIFPLVDDKFCFSPGLRTEVMSGCRKAEGMEILIRTMTPEYLAVDEITDTEDCKAVIRSGWCGVTILSTAHAQNMQDFMNRSVYKPLIESQLFDNIIVMQPDKSWVLERMNT